MVILPGDLLLPRCAWMQQGCTLYAAHGNSGNIQFWRRELLRADHARATRVRCRTLLAVSVLAEYFQCSGQFIRRAHSKPAVFGDQGFQCGQDTFRFLIASRDHAFILCVCLLRDAPRISAISSARFRSVSPTSSTADQVHHVLVKATVKGNIAVASVQGALGGFYFLGSGLQRRLAMGVA